MSVEIDPMSKRGKLSDETIDQLFGQLKAEDIEQFYMAYQLWSQRQQIEQLQIQMLSLQQKIDENTAQMEQFQPSAIALASLAQLQSCGVEDADLLDRMLERGDEWLDHSIELLERCERLDLIGGDYTQWCQHALEGAYDWLDSITDPGIQVAGAAVPIVQEHATTDGAEVTEEQLLRKLMSEDGDTEKAKQESIPEQNSRITQPLTSVDKQDVMSDETQKVATTKLPRWTTQPLPAMDELVVSDDQVETSSSARMETDQVLASSNITPTEIHPAEQVDNENETAALQTDRKEISDQESHPANIEENEITTLNSAEKEHEMATLPPATSEETRQQENETLPAERVDKEKSGNNPQDRFDEENGQQMPDLPSSKKNVVEKKKGFLHGLLAKRPRR